MSTTTPAPRSGSGAQPGTLTPPGVERPACYRPRLRYELIGCGLHGHELVGTDAATLGPEDALFARQDEGFRWYRCLRCDSWLALDDPTSPARDRPPDVDDIEVPLRGRALRDRYVLRAIAVERGFHLVVLAAISVGVFLFAANKTALHHDWTDVLNDLQGALGGPVNNTGHGLLSDVNKLFTLSTTELYALGVAALAYTAVLAAEMVGLWFARRWAEYLTFVEAGALIPFELYELAGSVSALKVVTLALNAAVVGYLLWAHRLFGIRGGAAVQEALRRESAGWEAVRRATLPALATDAD